MSLSNNGPRDAEHYISALQRFQPAVTQSFGATPVALRTLIGQIQALAKSAEDDRKTLKEPHLARGRAIDAEFKPVADMAETLLAPLKRDLADQLKAEESRRREEAERARKEAEAKAREAAAFANDPLLGDDVARDAAKAESDAKYAALSAKATTAVRGENGERALGLRLYRYASVTDPAALVAHFASHKDVIAAAEKLANAAIRARGAAVEIPGIVIIEEKRVA